MIKMKFLKYIFFVISFLILPNIARADITTGLVGYWSFENGTGATTVTDNTANNNNGTLTGTTWESGHIGSYSLGFDQLGTNLVTINSDAELDDIAFQGGSTGLTVAAWIYPIEYTTANMQIVSKTQSTGNRGWFVGLIPNASDAFTFVHDYGATDLSNRSINGTVSYNTWQHVVYTWDATEFATGVKIYKNGVELSYTSQVNGLTGGRVTDAADTLIIGTGRGSTRDFNGNIDEVRIYNRVLSSSDVSELYAYTAGDVTGPVISSVASSTTSGTATVTFNTDETATTTVEYGTTVSYGSSTSTSALATSHSLTIPSGLTESTLYHYRIKAYDASHNLTTSGDYTFLTQPSVDITAPVISSIASTTAATTATVTWTTDESSDSKVVYGTVSGTYPSSVTSGTLVTSHSVGLSGLSASTVYYYRVVSGDASGNISTSTEKALLTAAPPDIVAPNISSVASSTTSGGATITFNTNENATTTIEYGTTVSYGSSSSTAVLASSHSVVITGLVSGTVYHFRISAYDSSFNATTSTDYTFTTASADLNTGLITYWRFDENANTTVTDSIRGIIGSLTGGTSWDYSPLGTSSVFFDFDNAGKIVVGDSTSLRDLGTTTGMSISAWLHPDYDTLTEQYIVSKLNTTTAGWKLSLAGSANDGYAFYVDYQDTGSVDLSVRTADGSVRYGEWQHLVLTWDGSTSASNVHMYINGVENAVAGVQQGSYDSAVSAVGTRMSDLSRNFAIGANQVGSRPFRGNIDEVKVYGRVLTSSEVLSLYSTSDVTPPQIYGLASTTRSTDATITFNTSELATTTIQYGTTLSYGSASSTSVYATTSPSHSVNITGLTPGTTYNYRIIALDVFNNATTSGNYTFTTTSNDVTPPTITVAVASSTNARSATITWTTNEEANSQVEYGLTSSYTSSTTLNATTYVTSHSVLVDNLLATTTYHFRIKSTDPAGNTLTSGDYTFTTKDGAKICSAYGSCITLRNGDTWVFLGDSITDAHGYSDYIQSFFHLRYSGLGLHFRGAGQGGTTLEAFLDVAEGGTGLYDTVVNIFDPDFVSVMHGHNGPQDAVAYYNNYINLINNYIIARDGAIPILLGPHPQNESGGKPILGVYTSRMTDIATSSGYVYADIFTELLTKWEENLSAPSPVDLQGVDVTHPGPAGHLAIAGYILDDIIMDYDREVSSVSVNATTASLIHQRRASVSGITQTASGVDFTRLDERLPMAFDPMAIGVLALHPEIKDVNKYMIQVSGLTPGNYDIYIDDILSATTTASDLSTGFNAGFMTQGPIFNQAQETLGRIRDREGIERVDNAGADFISKAALSPNQGVLAAVSGGITPGEFAAVEALDALIDTAATPVSRTWSIRLTEASGSDSTAPLIDIQSPLNNATTTGVTDLVASSTDNIAVSGVKFVLDDTTDLNPVLLFVSPYTLSWNTALFADGTYTIKAVSRDTSNNLATSTAITVHIDNTAPVRSNGSPITTLSIGTTNTTLSLSTNEAATCKYSTGSGTAYGSMTAFSTTGGISHSATISGLSNSTNYTYYVKCQDAVGNRNASDYSISFSVAGDASAPTVSITAPTSGQVVAGASVTLSANAADDVSVSGVQFYIDSNAIGSEDTSSPYSITFDSTSILDGAHQISAIARDGSSNTSESASVSFTVDNTAPVRSNGAPTGNLAINTTQTFVTLDTNEVSTCKYSASSGTSYASMSAMTTPNGLAHTVLITGLANETSYTIYTKCRDGNNNTNLIDYTISFAVRDDVDEPNISNVSALTTNTTATITWSTNETSNSRVNFGPISTFTASSSDNADYVTSHSVALTGLKPCVKYFYRVRSADLSGNTAVSPGNEFTTKGCTGNASIISENESTISNSVGGTINLLSSGKGIILVVPPNFKNSTDSAYFQIRKLAKAEFIASASSPSGKTAAGNHVYSMSSLPNATSTISTFDALLDISISYDESEISEIPESSLKIHRYDDGTWTELSSCSVNESSNIVTCQTSHFSDFVLFGTDTGYSINTAGGSGFMNIGTSGASPALINPNVSSGGYGIDIKQLIDGNHKLNFNFGKDITSIIISDNPNFYPASFYFATSSIVWKNKDSYELYIKYCDVGRRCTYSLYEKLPGRSPKVQKVIVSQNTNKGLIGVGKDLMNNFRNDNKVKESINVSETKNINSSNISTTTNSIKKDTKQNTNKFWSFIKKIFSW